MAKRRWPSDQRHPYPSEPRTFYARFQQASHECHRGRGTPVHQFSWCLQAQGARMARWEAGRGMPHLSWEERRCPPRLRRNTRKRLHSMGTPRVMTRKPPHTLRGAMTRKPRMRYRPRLGIMPRPRRVKSKRCCKIAFRAPPSLFSSLSGSAGAPPGFALSSTQNTLPCRNSVCLYSRPRVALPTRPPSAGVLRPR